jgi:hypothetical protein
MKKHVEAWARYCVTHKYSVRMTIEQAIARNRAVLSVATWGPQCEVCGGALQVGYKVLLPTGAPRTYAVGYIHTAPDWCERMTEAKRVKEECTRLIEEAQALMRPQGEWEAHVEAIKQTVMEALESVDQEQRAGAQFDNILLAVSARIALAWIDLERTS